MQRLLMQMMGSEGGYDLPGPLPPPAPPPADLRLVFSKEEVGILPFQQTLNAVRASSALSSFVSCAWLTSLAFFCSLSRIFSVTSQSP